MVPLFNIQFFIIFISQIYFCNAENSSWTLIFYTTQKLFAGTNNKIFVELIGTKGTSGIQYIKPGKDQLEMGSVDSFKLDIDKDIGKIKKLIVGKEKSSLFFSDWYLDKIHVISPINDRITFDCYCKITREKISYTLYDKLNLNDEKDDEKPLDVKNIGKKILISGIMCIFSLSILCIIFKCRSKLYKIVNDYNNDDNIVRENNTRRSNGNRLRQFCLNFYKNDDDDDDNDESGSNLNRMRNRNRNMITTPTSINTNYIESFNLNNDSSKDNGDNPPPYNELFPLKTKKKLSTNDDRTTSNM